MINNLIHKRRRRLDFTLVELLVVIAIIAMLSGLLLPVLGKAKNTTKELACKSNLKQIAIGLNLYADDNKGRFPVGYNGAGTIKVNRYWFDLCKDYVNAKPGASVPLYRGSVFECASDLDRAAGTIYTSYLYPSIFWTYYATNEIRVAGISTPGSVGLMTDGWSAIGLPGQVVADEEGGRDTDRRLRIRHALAANILFCDSHVDRRKGQFGESWKTLFEVK